MSEAIIARGGKGIGQQVDLSGINASLVSINTRINQINSNLGSLWDTVNDISSGALDTATNTIMVDNGYYNCTKTGNYWVEVIGGGGGGWGQSSGYYYYWWGGASGYLNNGRVYLYKGNSVYVTIGDGGEGTFGSFIPSDLTGGTSSFGTYLSAAGGYFENGANPGKQQSLESYNALKCTGGWLYYNSSNSIRISTTGTTRIYYGDGGNGGTRSGMVENGNSGCVLITYID